MPIWFTIAIIITLIMWMYFAVLTPLFGGLAGTNNLQKGFIYPLFSYPIVAILAIVFIWIKRNVGWGISPLLLLLCLCIVFALFGLWKDLRSSELVAQDDKIFNSYNLDGLADIKVPKSFVWDSEKSIANFYGVEPIKDKFVYSFYLQRAMFNDAGGYKQAPVILSLSVYNSQASFDDWNDYVYSVQTGDSSKAIWDTVIQGTETLQKTDTTELDKLNFIGMGANNPNVTLLVYSYRNQNQKYRLGLLYWKNYLTDDAASQLLNNIIPSIAIKDSLSSRVQMIENEFYKKYPEKKP